MRKKRKKEGSTLVLTQWMTEREELSSAGKTDWTACLWHGLLMFVWTVAYIQWLNEALTLNIEIFPILVIIAVSCVILEIAIRLKCLWRAVFVSCFLLMIYIWFKQDSIMNGWDIIACRMADVVSDYYHVELAINNSFIGSEGFTPAMIVLSAVLILVVGSTTVKWRIGTAPGLLSLVILSASLIVDCFPSVAVSAILMIATSGLVVLISSDDPLFDGDVDSRIYVKSSAFVVCLLLAVFAFSYLGAKGYVNGEMRSYYDSIKEYPQQMITAVGEILSGKDGSTSLLEKMQNLKVVNFLDDSGKLTNRAPIQTGNVVLEMDTDKRPEEPLYLKNYSGAFYNVNKEQWESVEDAELNNIYETWQVSGRWSYEEAKQLLSMQLYQCLDRMYLTSPCSYEITDKGTSKCTWVPYGVDTGGLVMKGDSVFETSLRTLFDGYQMTDSGIMAEIFDGSLINPEAQLLFDEYTSYVYDTYLGVPDGMDALADRYRQLADQYGDVSVSQWIEIIQNDLDANCVYEKYDLEDTPSGSNLIDDFYGRQKKGYCIHFASAGVMLLRMAGIPARYVTGYMVSPDDFSYDNETGQYHADITGYRGHAWVEIYDFDSGVWLPVEMTPGDSAGNQDQNMGDQSESIGPETAEIDKETESGSNEGTEESAEEKTETDNGNISKEGTNSTAVSNTVNGNEGQSGELDNNGSGLGRTVDSSEGDLPAKSRKIVGAAAAVVSVFAVLIVICCYLKSNREKIQKFSRVNRNKAVLSMEWHLSEIMEKAGWKPEKNLSDWEYAVWVQERVDTLEDGEYLYFMEMLHQAAYSEEMLTEEEYQKCYVTYKKILRKIREKSTPAMVLHGNDLR